MKTMIVIEASSAIDALAIVNERRPALVISDALMPRLDGREMCRMIKSNPALSDTKVVLMSGLYTSTRYKIEAMAAFGADDYLAKPVRTARLLAMLQKFVPVDRPRAHERRSFGTSYEPDLRPIPNDPSIAVVQKQSMTGSMTAQNSGSP